MAWEARAAPGGGGAPVGRRGLGLAAPWLELPERSTATRDRALILRARVALAGGRPKTAVGPLQRVDPLGPWAAEAAFWKGRTLYAVGNMPLAIAWLRTALAARPTDAETLRWLAAAAYDLGDLRTVLESLKALTSLKPDDARAWRTLALVTREEPDGGEPELNAARIAYEKALALDPDQPRVRLEMADVLVKLGRYVEADRQLTLCRGRVPEADQADLLAQSAWLQGERDRCRRFVDAGLAAAPNHPGLLARRGLIAQSEGRLDRRSKTSIVPWPPTLSTLAGYTCGAGCSVSWDAATRPTATGAGGRVEEGGHHHVEPLRRGGRPTARSGGPHPARAPLRIPG